MPDIYQTPQFQETDKSRTQREPPFEDPHLKHFLQLANSTSGSSGADACRALANCLANNVPRLDASALRGMCVFAGLAKMAPETACNLIQD